MRPELRYVSAECPSGDFLLRPMQHVRVVMPVVFGPDQAGLFNWDHLGVFEFVDECNRDDAAVEPVDSSNLILAVIERASNMIHLR